MIQQATGLVVIETSTSSEDEAWAIARACVGAGLAACAHVTPIESIYRWKGRTHEDREYKVALKTSEASVEAISGMIRKHHSYEEPAIMTTPISGGSDSYLDWIRSNSTA